MIRIDFYKHHFCITQGVYGMRHTFPHKEEIALMEMERSVNHSEIHVAFQHIYHHFRGSEVLGQILAALEAEEYHASIVIVHDVFELDLSCVGHYLSCQGEYVSELIIRL